MTALPGTVEATGFAVLPAAPPAPQTPSPQPCQAGPSCHRYAAARGGLSQSHVEAFRAHPAIHIEQSLHAGVEGLDDRAGDDRTDRAQQQGAEAEARTRAGQAEWRAAAAAVSYTNLTLPTKR